MLPLVTIPDRVALSGFKLIALTVVISQVATLAYIQQPPVPLNVNASTSDIIPVTKRNFKLSSRTTSLRTLLQQNS